jgi:hypothetical protein
MAMSMDRLHGLLQVFVLSSVKHTRQTWHEWLMWRFGSPLRLRPPSVYDGERMTCSLITSAGLPPAGYYNLSGFSGSSGYCRPGPKVDCKRVWLMPMC